MLADVYPSNELGTVMGISLMFMSLGMLLGPPFGGVVYEYAGYETPFLIAAGIAAFDGLVRLLLVTDKLPKKEDNTDKIGINKDIESGTSSPFNNHNKISILTHCFFYPFEKQENVVADDEGSALLTSSNTPSAPRKPATMWTLLRNPDVLMTSAYTLIGAGAISGLEPTLPAHMESEFGSSSLIIGLVFMEESLIYGLISPLIGYLGDKFIATRHPTMAIGALLLAGALPILALPTEVWELFVAVLGMGVVVGVLLTPTLPILGSTHSPSFSLSLILRKR